MVISFHPQEETLFCPVHREVQHEGHYYQELKGMGCLIRGCYSRLEASRSRGFNSDTLHIIRTIELPSTNHQQSCQYCEKS